ncbi:transposase [Massilia atriviolacea]|uniref:Transposase IS66 central domain-containing protein n=1 Tax=Massilia atriviolacea TaxID=2495579 RepID=A0A430HSS2_9BURK|nr:hypothetical protein EJB06_05120 [Massilia atriviolacea]
MEPAQTDQARHAIAPLFKVERQIRDDGLKGQPKLAKRQERANPVLERFFTWIHEQLDKRGFLPHA